jgi:predicted dehydrogenase
MMNSSTDAGESRRAATSRREFLHTSSRALAGATLLGTLAKPRPGYTAENNTIKVALVGCGGRGTGAAANALSTRGPTQLVALADVFADRLEACWRGLSQRFAQQVDVPPERRFIGFDAFRHAIDAVGKGGVVLLATPPAFRPIHLEYAVSRGVHVFMEKSFAVDAPGVRRVLKAGEEATKKGLKIAGGLMSRHYPPLEEAVARIHDGALGQVITAWAYREHGPVGFTPKPPGLSELAHQIRNYSGFTWLNGSFLLDWLIHNIDVCCWVKDAWPQAAQGQGGRQARTVPDQLFDHYAVEYTFPDGTRLFVQGRHMSNCWSFFGNIIHGTTGSAVLGEGIPRPRLFRGHQQTSANALWDFNGTPGDPYQIEHDLLFDAIREDRPYNETERCARACMTAILGRMAVESGQKLTYDEAFASTVELAPGLDQIQSLNDKAPVEPDAQGRYPIAVPGVTTVV